MNFYRFLLGSCLFISLNASATVRYVDLNSPSPTPPFTSWATAATTIQDAIDAASAGDEVVVTNGVYQTGGSLVIGWITNRVSVTRPVTVRSVNGPAVTLIVGYQVPGSIYGDDAIRCVYLTNGASLFGFTITNGSTVGDWTEPPICGGGGVYCESASGVVSNCVIVGNAAAFGGGVYSGTIRNCSLIANTSSCYGGGASYSLLLNTSLTRNSASYQGGGAVASVLVNCTVTDNSPSGVDSCNLTNSIVYYNSPVNYSSDFFEPTLDFCCTTPLPASGTGNISAQPQLSSASHLATGSPCRGAGSFAATGGVDIDTDAWANPPSMGCDEFTPGAITGPLTITMQATLTNVAAGFPISFTASIEGRCNASGWDFADGTTLSNHPFATTHSWSASGDYLVLLTAYNESFPGGVSATSIVHVVEENHYVSLASVNPAPPYSSWATAATNIQDAVDVAVLPGAQIIVSNGVYATGGRVVYGTMTNRLAVSKPAVVRSVSGPAVTTIQGYQLPDVANGNGAMRCVYLSNSATLSGFTLTGGATRTDGDAVLEQAGGGAFSESTSAIVSNCVITGNAAQYLGGGASGGTLINSVLMANRATVGGAVYASVANNCTITNNYAAEAGGGAYQSTLNFCSISSNHAAYYGGGAAESTLNNCTLSGNSGFAGGGATISTLQACVITGNSAIDAGGGVNESTLTSYTLAGNSTTGSGGGANNATLHFCSLTGNTASGVAGGASSCTLSSCMLIGNSGDLGGGAYGGALNNCAINGNTARNSGGGVYGAILNNCTVTANSASTGGGASESTLTNCILYYNTASLGQNYSAGTLNYCCSTPLPAGGLGNISNEPSFVNLAASDFHLQANSPCFNAGTNYYAPLPFDLDGNPRIVGGAVDMGAYEFQSTQPVLRIVPAGAIILLAWPLWASDFELQQTTVLPPSLTDWSSSGVSPVIANGQNEVVVPIGAAPKLFRLSKPTQP